MRVSVCVMAGICEGASVCDSAFVGWHVCL